MTSRLKIYKIQIFDRTRKVENYPIYAENISCQKFNNSSGFFIDIMSDELFINNLRDITQYPIAHAMLTKFCHIQGYSLNTPYTIKGTMEAGRTINIEVTNNVKQRINKMI